MAHVGLAQQAAHHRENPQRVGTGGLSALGGEPERANRQRDRGVGPLGGAALGAAREHVAGSQVGEERGGRARGRCFGEGTSDVHAGVVVGAADPDGVPGHHICGGGAVELRGAGAVADLPDGEQLGQPSAVARREGCGDRVVGVGQRAGDVALVHVGGAQLHVAAVGLQPLVVLGGDAVAEDMHGLRLAAEARGELLRDEDVGSVGDLQDAGDRVVVGDRHEVHSAALGQLVDLLGWSGALGQPDRALHTEAGLL